MHLVPLLYDGTWQMYFPLPFRISRVEESAYQALREKLYAHKSDLMKAFKAVDTKNTGKAKEGDISERSARSQLSGHACC